MKRLGFYTGKIYDDTVDPSMIEECALTLNYKEPITDDDPYVVNKRAELKKRCEGYHGCPESQRG